MGTESPHGTRATVSLGETDRAAARARAPELERGTVLDHFMILDRLGAGGMGVVFSAYDHRLDRKVAIKILHGGAAGVGQSRLLREAQAMARLTHAHVLTVYEVGAFGANVFIVMELVTGADLFTWLAAEPRAPRAILDVFVQAGRGLLAAHRAGIIHRDFKPANVMVGDDGRARVTDFGVAKLVADAAVQTDPALGESTATLTAHGMQPGTPRYMSPEQRGGQPVDARADQFAFAVALHEALTGAHPFGEDAAPARPTRRLQSWIRAALAPALERAPEQRYPSMAPLLDRLARGPVARRRALLGAAGAATLALAAFLVVRPAVAPVCQGARAKLAGVWDPAIKAAVRKSFAATGRPYALSMASHVEVALDAYADGWVAMHTDACEATAVRREQSTALLDLRMQCLERRRAELAALTGLFAAEADPGVVDRAVTATSGLARLSGCADTASLTAAYPPPDDPAVAARVAALRTRLDRGQVLLLAGRPKEGLPLARAAAAEAADAGYPPVRAELQLLLANFQKEATPKEAEATFREALLAAAAAHDDARAATALTELVWLLGYRLHRFDEARSLRAAAEAAIVRAGDAPIARANLLFNLGTIEDGAGNYAEARRLHEQALAIREKVFGPDHPDVARSLNSLGNVLFHSGAYPEAQATLERAVAVWTRALAPNHTLIAAGLTNLGEVAEEQGRHEQALELSLRALAILEDNLGPEHPNLSTALIHVGNAKYSLGRFAEAAADQGRALAIREKAFGADSNEVAAALSILGDSLARLDRGDEALALMDRALAIREKVLGPDHPDVAWPLLASGQLRVARGDAARALPDLRRAVALRTKAFGTDNVRTAEAQTALAECQLALGDPAPALVLAEPALAVLQRGHGMPEAIERARFVLAQALWATGHDRRRARDLGEQSRRFFAGAGPVEAEQLARVDRWLEHNR